MRPIATGTFPSPKACASFVSYKNSLILFGGWSHSSPYPIHQEWRIFNHIHIFDIESSRWNLIVPKSFSPAMAGHAASVINDEMIVFGGLQTQSNSPQPFSISSDVCVLDLKNWVWRKQPTSDPKPFGRYGHSQIVLDSQNVLIIGGCGGPNKLFSDIWLLTITNDETPWIWKKIDVQSKHLAHTPQISFHPACKVTFLWLQGAVFYMQIKA